MNTKIKEIKNDVIYFDNGYQLYSNHEQDCCENHYLSFEDITPKDYEDLEFDLSNDDFFKRIEGYGIELIATNNFPLRIPGYGYNNGYYSSNLDLILVVDSSNANSNRIYDVTECQEIEG